MYAVIEEERNTIVIRGIKKAVVALPIAAILLTGCAVNIGKQVYDNDEMLGADYDRYSSEYFSQSSEGNILSGSAEKLEGMRTIKKFDSSGEGEISLSFNLSVSSGKAKIVLVAPDGTVTIPGECTSEEKELTDDKHYKASEGEYRIKMVGDEGTRLEYEITINADGNA